MGGDLQCRLYTGISTPKYLRLLSKCLIFVVFGV